MTLILGLTGSIGMGKSTVAQMFRDEGVPVFDADAEVHLLQGPGGALIPAIEAAFPGTTGPDGVNRALLGQQVFGDRDALARLEALVLPAVVDSRRRFMSQNKAVPVVVFDIPLLFEKGGADAVDRIIVVSAPADIQRARVLARPGMTEQKFEQILDLQMPDADKRARADFVIPTGCDPDDTRAEVRRILACVVGPGDS